MGERVGKEGKEEKLKGETGRRGGSEKVRKERYGRKVIIKSGQTTLYEQSSDLYPLVMVSKPLCSNSIAPSQGTLRKSRIDSNDTKRMIKKTDPQRCSLSMRRCDAAQGPADR